MAFAFSLGGCTTAPPASKTYFDASEAGRNPVPIAAGSVPTIALAGVGFTLRRKSSASTHTGFGTVLSSSEGVTSAELDLTPPERIKALLASVSGGLAQSPGIQAESASDIRFLPPCSEPVPPTEPSARPGCTLPAKLEPMTAVDQLRSRGYSHLLLLLQAVTKDSGPKETVWGAGLGGPVFTTETKLICTFALTARLYDLSTGAVLTETRAEEVAEGAFGWMLVFFPYYIAPDEAQFMAVLGRAVGLEIGRRFRRATP